MVYAYESFILSLVPPLAIFGSRHLGIDALIRDINYQFFFQGTNPQSAAYALESQ